jgi:hypothetical protein
MTGATQETYAQMMIDGGRSVEGNRSRSGKGGVGSVLGEQGKPKAAKKAAKPAKAKAAKAKSAKSKSAKSKSKAKRK